MLPFVKPVEVKQYFDDEQFGYDEMIHKIIEKEEINTNERNIILTHQFVTARGEDVEKYYHLAEQTMLMYQIMINLIMLQ